MIGLVTNRSPSTQPVNAECCIMPSESEDTTRHGSESRKIMPTIDELGTIFVTFGRILR